MTRLSAERVTREDMVMFINACFACNGQSEFYGDAEGEGVSISFLHEYIAGNYRRLYARTLAAGINHFNQGLIIQNLLAAGAPARPEEREEEGALLSAALRALPTPRALRVLASLRERRVNNRRSRAIVREYLASRPDLAFTAIKYRTHLRALAAHAHLTFPGEVGEFLFHGAKRQESYKTPLLEAFRRASYDPEALYELPFTIAEGFAARHGIDRAEFLRKIEPRMTAQEKLRFQKAAAREEATIEIDLGRVPLTRLALYILSLSFEERAARREELDAALRQAAARVLARSPMRLGKVAAVLDRSYSSSGTSEKRRRPLAVALGVSYLLRAASSEYAEFWTSPTPDVLLVSPKGQTDLATPLVEALRTKPDLVVIISDGFENDPPGGAAEVARIFRRRIDPMRRTSLVHLNPVFDSERYAPRALGPSLPTVGLRDAEDLLTMLGFARFAEGTAPLSALESYLEERVREFLRKAPARPMEEAPVFIQKEAV